LKTLITRFDVRDTGMHPHQGEVHAYWMMEGKKMTTTDIRLTELVVAVLDTYYDRDMPKPLAWLLPFVQEAMLSGDAAYQQGMYDLFAYVAHECGVQCAQELMV
jgi:hypothetical protein